MAEYQFNLPEKVFVNSASWFEAFKIMNGELRPADASDWRVEVEVRPALDSRTVSLRFTTEDGGATIVDDPEADAVYLHLERDAEQMVRVPPGDYVREILLIMPSGRKVFGGRGMVTLEQGFI